MEDKKNKLKKFLNQNANSKTPNNENIAINSNNINIVNSFNQTNIKPQTKQSQNKNISAIFIENELEKRNRTIEKLTLWVLNIELSSLEGLSEVELLKLRYFLENNH